MQNPHARASPETFNIARSNPGWDDPRRAAYKLREQGMSLKSTFKSTVPYPWAESARKLIYWGNRYRCSVCGASLRKRKPQGYGYPVLEELQVVGGMYKENDVCPVCLSGDRDRLVMFYVQRHMNDGSLAGKRLLHIAPEKGLTKVFKSLAEVEYIPGDIEPSRYWHLKDVRAIDLLDLPFPNKTIDVVVCNHVLEHIVDDVAAMREIRRVLTTEGLAILQTPISLKLTQTREGTGTESEAERIARFGQKDHVRIYTRDGYVERLESAGFSVEQYSAFREDAVSAAELQLNPLEILFVCRPDRREGAAADGISGRTVAPQAEKAIEGAADGRP
jgi:SAM-dependent methyltransferase